MRTTLPGVGDDFVVAAFVTALWITPVLTFIHIFGTIRTAEEAMDKKTFAALTLHRIIALAITSARACYPFVHECT